MVVFAATLCALAVVALLASWLVTGYAFGPGALRNMMAVVAASLARTDTSPGSRLNAVAWVLLGVSLLIPVVAVVGGFLVGAVASALA